MAGTSRASIFGANKLLLFEISLSPEVCCTRPEFGNWVIHGNPGFRQQAQRLLNGSICNWVIEDQIHFYFSSPLLPRFENFRFFPCFPLAFTTSTCGIFRHQNSKAFLKSRNSLKKGSAPGSTVFFRLIFARMKQEH